jgi:Holliday junction DNA helicase RuvB
MTTLNATKIEETLAAIEAANRMGLATIKRSAEERNLAPPTWASYIGQTGAKRRLELAAARARDTHSSMPHVLLTAKPGMGKTTLARLVAHELGRPIIECDDPLDGRGLALKAMELHPGGVLFLDELHLYSRGKQTHSLMKLLLEGTIPEVPGVEFDITVIGATTEPQALFPALMGRFPLGPSKGVDLVDYTHGEMCQIVQGMVHLAGVDLDDATVELLATAANGVPRDAQWMMVAAADMSFGGEPVNGPAILELMGLDPDGLTLRAQEILALLAELGPQSKGTLQALVHASPHEITAAERILLRHGYIEITSRGRDCTPKGLVRVQPLIAAGRPS